MIIEEISNYSDFKNLEVKWNVALQNSNIDSLFLTYEWISSWWKNLGENKRLFILIVRENAEILAIAPFMISKGTLTKMPVQKVEFISAGWGQGDFILCDKKEICIELIWEYLRRRFKTWDAVVLSEMPSESGNVEIIDKTIKKTDFIYIKERRTIPYISLRSNWNDYISQRPYSFRRNYKNRERRLHKIGKVAFIRYNSKVHDINKLMDTVFDISRRSWKSRMGTAIASDEKVKKFYLDLANKFYENRWLDISILTVDEKPISYAFGSVYNRKYIDIDIAFDIDYSPYSPGNLHRGYLLQQLFLEDLDIFDFVMAAEYKKQLATSEKEFYDVFIFKKKFYSIFQFIVRSKIYPLLRKRLSYLKKQNYNA